MFEIKEQLESALSRRREQYAKLELCRVFNPNAGTVAL